MLKTKLKRERPTNKQQIQVVALKAWQIISREKTWAVVSMGSRLQVENRILIQVLKIMVILTITSLCPNTFDPLKIAVIKWLYSNHTALEMMYVCLKTIYITIST